MKVILKQDVKGQGKAGQLVQVSDGYARNFLIPQKKAILATESAKKVLAENLKQRAHKLEKIKKEDRKSRDVAMLPLMPQFRTTAHLIGDYTFTEGDVYRHFEDSVCAINDFEYKNYLYEVPLRALCRRDYPNMITAGRSASAEGYGWDVIRVIPPAILTGQAAGEATALAIESGVGVAEVDIKALQSRLESEDVMIHFPDEYVPEDKSMSIREKVSVEIPGGHF